MTTFPCFFLQILKTYMFVIVSMQGWVLVAVCVVHVNTLPCKEHSVSGTLPDKGCEEIHI